ncbi:DNA repair protein RecN [Histidinibacterium lentulum]|uniref:DNA repair protein RecN n=1 Tax=Histidinibacterium lentulum TaxID=2480588 RepID=A0A3N2QYJ9_9RHOB|nr:DNA repair protein RecN [Histidinibacterium lentulum]ROU00277.1 DNA repair protein RecN [Histidinibacterium lentulum]
MLRSLEIRDILIIDRLALEFQPGLNVLTGETGAGKSILLDALGFVLGWRGRADLVRAGAEQGEVTASFDLPEGHPCREVLEEAGIGAEEEELLLRRVTTQGGRKTAWVNGSRVPAEVLRQLSERLVELHGQHDDRGLLNPRGHRALLDAFGGLDTGPLRAAWRARREAAARLDAARQAAEALREEEETLRAWVAELEAVAPEAGEEEALDRQRRLMKDSRGLQERLAEAEAALSEEGIEPFLNTARRALERVAERAEGALDAALEALDRAFDRLGDVQAEVARFREGLDFDPFALERVEDRLHAIRDLSRKHGVLPDELPALAEELAGRLQALDASEGDLKRLGEEARAAEGAYGALASSLSGERASAAAELERRMAEELAPLKMERAAFTVEVAPGEAGPEGRDSVTFLVATNPGAPAGALGKIASGGELSRFLLALKVCLTRGVDGLTLIFDEIDRGVGGATAAAVGRRLARLAAAGQVLVVTHSPQVAALGQHHWRVEKRQGAAETLTNVAPLDAGARVDEIARMLSGDTLTEAAREAARALMTG